MFGIAIQRLCARLRQRAFCFSRLHATRLREYGLRTDLVVLEGEYAGSLEPEGGVPVDSCVVFAGRLIPEKRAESVVPAIALASAQVSGLHGVIFGDGPQRDAVIAAIAALERPEIVSAPGFVDAAELQAAVRGACCMVLPSRREGYGIIVLEAAVYGTPSIVVREPDNAAVELIEEGVNGIISASADPADLAAAIVRIHAAGEALRESTREWFGRNARRLSLDSSLATVLATYESAIARR